MKNNKNINILSGLSKKWVPYVLWSVAVLALAAEFAMARTWQLTYNPINGDFQSYNVFRRIFDGQVPYVDFANYIGMAPVLINLPLLIFSKTFAASLFVTNFTSLVLFCVMACVIFYLVTQNIKASLLISVLLPKVLSTGIVSTVLGQSVGGYIENLFAALYTPGNSMRIARMALPFLVVVAFLVFSKLYERKKGVNYTLIKAPLQRKFCLIFGLVCGICIVWSNDFGLSMAFCSVVLMILLLWRYAENVKVFFVQFGMYIAALAVGALLGISVVTAGHPMEWLNTTMQVGEYQYFYFNGTGGKAVIPYIFTSPRLLIFTLPYVCLLVFCLVKLIRKSLSEKMLLGGFLAFCVLVATYVYVVGGSGYNFTEGLEGVFWLTVMAFCVKGILHMVRRWDKAVFLSLISALAAVAVVFSAVLARDIYNYGKIQPSGVYFEALGGVADYPKALTKAAQLTEGEEVFSVYATGLEVVKDDFQPTGYDYIIHALGENAQTEYVNAFLSGDYPYVQTMSLDIESWLCVQNWYFYRHVVMGYERSFETEYSWIWEKSNQPKTVDVNTSLDVEKEGDMYIITISSDDDIDFVADVSVTYKSDFAHFTGEFLSLGRSAVAMTVPSPIKDGQTSVAFMPKESEGWLIPITVRDGVGQAMIYPSDPMYADLEIEEVTILQTFADVSI